MCTPGFPGQPLGRTRRVCLCVFSIALTECLGVIFKIGVCFGSLSVGPEAQDETAVLDEGQV